MPPSPRPPECRGDGCVAVRTRSRHPCSLGHLFPTNDGPDNHAPTPSQAASSHTSFFRRSECLVGREIPYRDHNPSGTGSERTGTSRASPDKGSPSPPNTPLPTPKKPPLLGGVFSQVCVDCFGSAFARACRQDHGGSAGHGIATGVDPVNTGFHLALIDQQAAPGMGSQVGGCL